MNNLSVLREVFGQDALKQINKILKSMFRGQITANFMLETMYDMISIYPDLSKYIQSQDDIESIISGNTQTLFYVLCEHIVGVHRSKIIFLSDLERSKLEENKIYKRELMEDVYKEIKLRPHINSLIRSNQLIRGDRFLLFPVPYYLAVIESKFLTLCTKSKEMPSVYVDIANKSLAVLSLLQDNFMDCSYSTCRVIIEDYIRATIFRNCPEAKNEYYQFAEYELEQSLGYPFKEEFLNRYRNRLNKKSHKIIDYLHYGWVDIIPSYHKIVKKNPYSFGGIKTFIVEKFTGTDSVVTYNLLDYYHSMCHGYAHGSMASSKYPLLHYFEVSSILASTTANAYYSLCLELGVDSSVDGIDVIKELNKHYDVLQSAESKKSTDNFENYYKNFKM